MLEALDADGPEDEDDTLTLLLHCCHPELSAPSQIALTLRAVGGLTTAEIASAFLVPEATMAQRISRAKARIRATGTVFSMGPAGAEREERLRTVLHVLYLIFNEGYTARLGAVARTRGADGRGDPTDACGAGAAARRRRGRRAARADAADRRAAGGADDGRGRSCRSPSRTVGAGTRADIAEGVALVTTRWPGRRRALPGAGRHRRRARRGGDAGETDWPQIVALYELLEPSRPTRW